MFRKDTNGEMYSPINLDSYMNFLRVYEDYIYESTGNGSIEAFIEATRIGAELGIFTDQLFKEAKQNFVDGIEMSLRSEKFNIPSKSHNEFDRYIGYLMKDIKKSKDLISFLTALLRASKIKEALLDRMKSVPYLEENNTHKEDWIRDGIRDKKESAIDWLGSNPQEIAKNLSKLLIDYMSEIIDTVAKSLQIGVELPIVE